MTQSDPFCTSIITSNLITRAHYDDIIIKNGNCFLKEEPLLADVSAMMSSELRRYCNIFSFFKLFYPHVPTGSRTA